MPTSAPSLHVLVLGEGLAALAAAVHGLAHGVRVTWIESGNAARLERVVVGGVALAPEPEVVLLPRVFTELATSAGRLASTYFPFRPVRPAACFHFADGVVVRLQGDAAADRRTLEQQFPGAGAGARFDRALLDSRAALARLAPFDSAPSREPRRIGDHLDRVLDWFDHADAWHLAALENHGLHACAGGERSLAIGLEQLAAELGVIHHRPRMVRVLREGDRPTGFDAGAGPVLADAVLSFAPTAITTTAMFAFGLARPYDHLGPFNVLFSPDAGTEREDLHVRGVAPQHPTLRVWTRPANARTRGVSGVLLAALDLPPVPGSPDDTLKAAHAVVRSALAHFGLTDLHTRVVAEQGWLRPVARATSTSDAFPAIPDPVDAEPAARVLAGVRAMARSLTESGSAERRAADSETPSRRTASIPERSRIGSSS